MCVLLNNTSLVYIELQGTTLKIIPENLKSRNLNKLAISLKLDLQHCLLGYDKFIKINTWSINFEHLRCDNLLLVQTLATYFKEVGELMEELSEMKLVVEQMQIQMNMLYKIVQDNSEINQTERNK